MIIATLKNLDAEIAGEIAGHALDAAEHDKMLELLHNGTECAVLCIACEVGSLVRNYYDVVFADGTRSDAISGHHLAGIQHWK